MWARIVRTNGPFRRLNILLLVFGGISLQNRRYFLVFRASTKKEREASAEYGARVTLDEKGEQWCVQALFFRALPVQATEG